MSVMASHPPNMPAGAGSKRPRLSLQIKPTISISTSTAARPASRGFPLNPSDPTAFNTLSNAYVTAIERTSTPVTSPSAEPMTAITTFQAISLSSPVHLRPSAYPETPVSAYPASPNIMMPLLPSVMSPTPPMSAGAVGDSAAKVFSFSPRDAAAGRHSLEQALHAAAGTAPASPTATPPKRRRASRSGISGSPPPYTHAKALHSILRNSPLPSRRPATAPSPRRLHPFPTVRIQEHTTSSQTQQRAAKRVCYHSPIEQEITTNTYTKSHIDLLVEEASNSTSPCSPRRLPVDLSRAFSANEIQDGGQTPGPFADESRRLGAAMTRVSPGGAVRKSGGGSKEKKRRWVWTIGKDEAEDEDEVDEEQMGGAVVAAARAAAAAAAAGNVAKAPLLAVPKPRVRMMETTNMADVEMTS